MNNTDNIFIYNIKKDEAIITGITSNSTIIRVPEEIEHEGTILKVTEIGKKAFWGNKSVKEIILPESVMSIGDWAFARCTMLKKITIPGYSRIRDNEFSLGRKVFEGCTGLENIVVPKETMGDFSYLAAALTAKLPGEYLLHDDDIGSGFWFEKWDLALISYIKTGDHEGYTDTVLCGEEDISYDGIASVDGELLGETYEYVRKITKAKSWLCMLRLVHDRNLSEENRTVYKEYIKAHSKKVGNEAAWLVVKEDGEEQPDFVELYVSIMGNAPEQIEDYINDLDESKTRTRSYLISLRKKETIDDLFDSMML